MHLRADFNQREVVLNTEYQWVNSPMPGVERMMLDRVGEEVARATSIVRYAPHSTFSSHIHTGGEEFLVLAGVFGDEHGDYPRGTYVRNPIGTEHTPRVGAEGATLFVKLQQFDEADTQACVISTVNTSWRAGLVTGLQVMPLHQFGTENVALVKWAPHTRFQPHTHLGGEEILVLEGVFRDEHGVYPQGSWLRSPHRSRHNPFTEAEGALIWVKTGHLAAPVGLRR